MKKILIGAVAASVLAATCAQADNSFTVNRAGTWYVSPAVGIYYPGGNRDLDNSPMVTITGGYNFDQNLAAQLMLGSIPTTTQASGNDNGQPVSGYITNLEGLVNMPITDRLIPYVSLGAGFVKLQESKPDAALGAGLNYFIGPDMSLGLNYRHINQINGDYSDDMATFGVTWTFGGQAALKAAPVAQVLSPKQQAMMTEAKQTLQYVLPNGVELCNGTTVTPQQGCVTVSGDQMVMHLDVKFANNKALIGGKFPAAIDRLATFMNQYPSTSVVLYGYASKVGTEAYNQQLSSRRAQKVSAYLESKGIAASRINTQGMGTQNPLASNDTKAGRALNRRVEAAVPVPLKSSSATAPASAQ